MQDWNIQMSQVLLNSVEVGKGTAKAFEVHLDRNKFSSKLLSL